MTCVILHQIYVNAIPFDIKLQSLLTPDLFLQLPDALLVCGALRLGCGLFGLSLPPGFLQLRRVQMIPPIHPVPESQVPVHPAYRQHQDFAVSPDNAVGFGERLRRAGSLGLAGRSWHTGENWRHYAPAGLNPPRTYSTSRRLRGPWKRKRPPSGLEGWALELPLELRGYFLLRVGSLGDGRGADRAVGVNGQAYIRSDVLVEHA